MPPYNKNSAPDTVVIGIDPGTAITGYGIIRGNSVLEYGVIRTPAHQPIPYRLATLYARLTELLDQYRPTQAGCEKVFFSKNVKTALDVGQARGVILLALTQHNVTIAELTPPQVKQSVTGYGAATKIQIQRMTQRILQLKQLPKPDDAADALAIALAAQYLVRLV